MDKDNTVACAGGFIIQMMPFAKEETISQIEENLKNITSVTDHLKKVKHQSRFWKSCLEISDLKLQVQCRQNFIVIAQKKE